MRRILSPLCFTSFFLFGSNILQAQTVIQNWASISNGLNLSYGIVADASGNIYTADPSLSAVSKITPAGVVTQIWAQLAYNANPEAIAVDASGNVYTANHDDNTVSKITAAGTVTQAWATLASNAMPEGIAIDAQGNVYTANFNNSTISKITPGGTITQGWAINIPHPLAIAVDAQGNVYTANNNSAGGYNGYGNISKITPDGTTTWWNLVLGAAPNQGCIAIDAAGNVFVGSNVQPPDATNYRAISKITPDGTLTQSWWASTTDLVTGIVTDKANNVYATTYAKNTVNKIAPDGTATQPWATLAADAYPWGIAIDAQGNLYTDNMGNNTVSKILNNNALPLTLLSFTGSVKGNNVQLQWQTANEANTSRFNIQRSTSGKAFANVGSVAAIGSGNNSYAYTDDISALNTPSVYYRLQSVDKDGSVSFTKIITVVPSNTQPLLSIYPNPAKDAVFVTANNLSAIKIINTAGKAVIEQTYNNANNASIGIASLAKGIYIVQITYNNGSTKTEKLVVQ